MLGFLTPPIPPTFLTTLLQSPLLAPFVLLALKNVAFPQVLATAFF